jgi:hypothetical protein
MQKIPIHCDSNRIYIKEIEVRDNRSNSKSFIYENKALGPRQQGYTEKLDQKRKQEATQTTLRTDTMFQSELVI